MFLFNNTWVGEEMKIAICDDEEIFLNRLYDHLITILEDEQNNIDRYSCGEALLDTFFANKYDIIILDIEMNGMNGIETANEIRNIDRNVKISFLTSYEDFAIEGYKVKAERYILKQQPEYMYREQINGLINDYNQDHKKFKYSNSNSAFSARLSDIIYFEVYNRQIVVHISEQEFMFYGKISDLESEYKCDGFIRVGKSYLINAAYIKFIDGNDIIMKNGQSFLMGRTVKNQVIEEYLNYLSGK